MKTFRLILSAAILWGLSISCNNEIDMFPGDAPDMLYVIGCLDGSGTVQQVKVRRLINGKGDATVMVNDPAYYLPDTSVRVYLEEPSGNIIYQLGDYGLAPGQTYTLKIENPANGKTLSSSISALMPAEFTYPVPAAVVHGKFRFTDPERPFHISYLPASATVWTVSFKYLDFMLNGDTLFRKVTFSDTPKYAPQNEYGRDFQLAYVLGLLNKLILDDPMVDFRMFYRFDFSVWTGDEALANYLNIASRFTDNRKQYFSNIKGGMGLFFAVHHAKLKNVCPLESFNSVLADSSTIRHLKFVRFLYNGPYTDPDSTLFNPFFSQVR
ncbi:MAG: DUF4249 family protein [Bacteroidia bacterium]|nr:DUF4249 family protein [Bacteroidia bacterium]